MPLPHMTQRPLISIIFRVESQEVHSSSDGPEHVLQDGLQTLNN